MPCVLHERVLRLLRCAQAQSQSPRKGEARFRRTQMSDVAKCTRADGQLPGYGLGVLQHARD
eukprot:2135594-Alexandrium_andersonii.AAC.1